MTLALVAVALTVQQSPSLRELVPSRAGTLRRCSTFTRSELMLLTVSNVPLTLFVFDIVIVLFSFALVGELPLMFGSTTVTNLFWWPGPLVLLKCSLRVRVVLNAYHCLLFGP